MRLHFKPFFIQVPKQRVESFVLGENNAMRAWRFFNHAPKLASNVKIKGIAAISIDALPFHSIA